jgi:uncharacterized protein YjbI with pentapeptide repeats
MTVKEAVLEAIASGSDLSGSDLSDSDLRHSDLRGSKLSYSNLSGSNLRGSDLSDSDLSDSDLSYSNLSYSDLSYSNLSGSNLRDSDLSYSDLSYSDLRGSDLSDSNLRYSNLSDSDLRYSDLRGSKLSDSTEPADLITERDAARANHPRIPIVENLDTKIAESIAAHPDDFDMSQWHCGTKHCRAGWAVHLAGEAGYKLQSRLGPFLAGRLIYLVSTGRRPDFFATNDAARTDIERCAKESTP